jgi:hypothetical protein
MLADALCLSKTLLGRVGKLLLLNELSWVCMLAMLLMIKFNDASSAWLSIALLPLLVPLDTLALALSIVEM